MTRPHHLATRHQLLGRRRVLPSQSRLAHPTSAMSLARDSTALALPQLCYQVKVVAQLRRRHVRPSENHCDVCHSRAKTGAVCSVLLDNFLLKKKTSLRQSRQLMTKPPDDTR